ncbi:MAG: hypothetical protein IT305_20610 [Chloroflexi bacterium]|nr:hypothetical protein [Chloroflexota bacterium]
MSDLMRPATSHVPSSLAGWRILGFGKHPEHAAAIQRQLRSRGIRATNFALTDDAAGDTRLVHELRSAEYDGVAIGGFINGQSPTEFPATEATTLWFNRILNLIHAHASATRIILVRRPDDALPAIERVLGRHPDSEPASSADARGRAVEGGV